MEQLANPLKKTLTLCLFTIGFSILHAATYTVGNGGDFPSLSVAVSSPTVTAESTLEILEDQTCNNITISKNLTLRKSPNVTGDIVLNYSGINRHFTISANTSVSFENLIFQGPNATSGGITQGGGIVSGTNVANSTITLTNCSIKGCRANGAGGAISFATASQTVVLNNTEITDCSATTTGGGIHCAGTVSITNSTISNNIATTIGGGIYAAGALTLNDVTISGNKAGWSNGAYTGNNIHGGGVYANSNLTLKGAIEISNNGARSSGGGIYKNTATAPFDVTGLTFLKIDGNSTDVTTGGGIYTVTELDFSKATNLETIEIKNNSAVTTGGGISTTGVLVLTKATVSDNTAIQNGGGIYATSALILNNTTITGNKAGWTSTDEYSGSYHGGGVYASNNLTLQGAIDISNNGTSNSGGGIYKNTATAPFDVSGLTSLKMNGNIAKSATGGGIHTATNLDFTTAANLLSAEINNNETGTNGGGIYAAALLGLKNITISGNKAGYNGSVYASADNRGGGVYANNSLILAGNVTVNNNTAGNTGGGIYKSNTGNTFIITTDRTFLTVNGNEAKGLVAGGTTNGLGGGIYIAAALPLDLTNAVTNISNNTARVSGGGIYTTGTLTFKDATISNNTAQTISGGGIYTNNTILATNVKISGNNAALQGGGIYINTQGLTIFDSEISGNKAGQQGGGVYTVVNNQNNFVTGFNLTLSDNIAGWDFANNTYSSTSYNGGGIFATGPLAFNDALTVTNNTATGSGGGIYKGTGFIGLDVAEVKILTLTGNQSIKGDGGGIYSAFEMLFTKQEEGKETRAVISGNKAGGSGLGGAIYTTKDLYLSFINDKSSTIISDNEAGQNGGAFYVKGGLFTLSKATISGNKAAASGGAFYMGDTKVMTIQKSTFVNNSSGSLGGAIHSESSNTSQEISNCTFSGNKAANNGGAIAFSKGGASVYYCTLNGNSTTQNSNSNAIYWNAGTLNLNGNIIYGNGAGDDSEINRVTGTLIANYNIVREQALVGANNQKVPAGEGTTIFASVDVNNSDLAVLANNGGHTQTIMIKEGKLANGQIPMVESMSFGGNSSSDQRDINRLNANVMDIGSVQITQGSACQGRIDSTPIVWYVDKSASSSGDGMNNSSLPATDLASVLNNPCLMFGDIIKITSGTYYSTNTDPNNTFMLKKGVSILGGYTSDFNEANRDFKNSPTILDGNAKSYHVVSLFTSVDEPSQLDGIVIQNGKALGSSASQTYGAGIYCYTGKLLLSNAIVKDNVSLERGGGIYIAPNGAALTVRNVSFTGNKSGYNGTAIVAVSETGSPSAAGCMKSSGGAICAEGNLELQGSLYFDNNESGGNGGSIMKGVQNEFIASELDTLIITNSTAYVIDGDGNWGGGGIYTMVGLDLYSVKELKVHNSIAVKGQGGGIFTNNKTIGRLILKVNNGDFYNCQALGSIGDGGAIESYSSTSSLVILKNSTFDNCQCTRYGGALGIGNVLKLEGTIKINNSTAGTNGGGITHWAGPKGFPEYDEFDVQQCDTLIVTNCKTTGSGGIVGGGGIWIQQSNVDFSPIKYMLIEGNTCAVEGGGIKLVGSAYKLTLGNAIFRGNKAGTTDGTTFTAKQGGGIYSNSQIEIKSGKKTIIEENISGGDGGGIYCGAAFTANQADTLIVSNNESGKAGSGSGAGIYAKTTSTIANATFTANKAKTNGGGIYATGEFTCTNSTFDRNMASTGGGIYANNKSTRKISNSTFGGNTATNNNGGGAIYSATADDVVQIALSTFTGNTTGNNQATAFFFNNATGKTLNGNIIYGNGTGTAANAEISVAPTAANYNITRNLNLGGSNKMLGDGELLNLFETGTLADNGGKTQTIMIKKGGPAHNYIPKSVVDSWTAFDLGTDQRGISRPVGCNEEVGAVEINNEDIPVITFTIPDICSGTEINLIELITSATHVRDTLFYSNAAYTTPITNPTTYSAAQSPVYVRFNTTSNCVKDTIMALTINPIPAKPAVSNSAFCYSAAKVSNLLDKVTTTIPIGNTLNCYDAADSQTPLLPGTGLTSNTTYWLSQTSDKGCESPRLSVLVTVQQSPSVSINPDEYFLCNGNAFILDTKIENVTIPIPWYQWEIKNPATGKFEPGTADEFYPGVTVINAQNVVQSQFTPKATSYDGEGKVTIRLNVNTGACGYTTSNTLELHRNTAAPVAEISIAGEPEGLQSPCTETSYTLKIKDVGNGGLGDIAVTLSDWKYTDISVVRAEYQNPEEPSTWVSLPIDKDNINYTCHIPVKLHKNEVFVRFAVKPECGFYAGSNLQFIVNGYDACLQAKIDTKSVESQKFHLDFGQTDEIEYELVSHLDKTFISSSISGDPQRVKWTVDYYQLIKGNPDFSADSIYFRIPYGMDLDLSSFDSESYPDGFKVRKDKVSEDGGIEYVMPLSDDILEDDVLENEVKRKVSFSFVFTVSSEAICGTDQLYMEIIRQGKIECGGKTCDMFESLAQSYPAITVEWLQLEFVPNASTSGQVKDGKWTGSFNILTKTDILPGLQAPFDFYADTNGNARRDIEEIDTKIGSTIYFTTPANPAIIAGQVLPITITTPVPVPKDANSKPLGLLGYIPVEALVCEPLTIPIVPLLGEENVCQGDTVIYMTAQGMEQTTFTVVPDGVSGATPKRISAERNDDDWTSDVDKSVARLVIRSGRDFDVVTQYRVGVGSEDKVINSTAMKVTATAKSIVTLVDVADTTVCNGSPVELRHFISDSNNANPDTWLFYQKNEEDESYTLIGTTPRGAEFFVTPGETTTYAISSSCENACESNKVDFTVVVNEMPVDGDIIKEDQNSIVKDNVCAGSTETYSVSNEGNGLSYVWSVTGASNFIVGSFTYTGPEVTVMWNEPGELKVIYTTNKGCSAEKSLPVTLKEKPEISVSVSEDACSQISTITFIIENEDWDNTWSCFVDGDLIPYDKLTIQSNEVSFILTETETGIYTHNLTVVKEGGCESSPAKFYTSFYPSESEWTAIGEPGNWNDPANWDNGVPGECTDVIIPGGKNHYPVLTEETNATCKTIEFGFGGEVARTDLLTYNAAKVNLNVNTMQWYNLSAPLSDMYSGDYMFERANPITEMKLYNTTSPQTGAPYADWTQSFNNTNIRLNAGEGYSTRVGRVYYKEVTDAGAVTSTMELITTAPPWAFPQTKMLFNFYDDVSKKLLSKTEKIPEGGRDYGSRFIYEKTMSGEIFVEVPSKRTDEGQNVVVGNPLMSHIDFEKFYRENKDVIIPSFKILGNGTDFLTYSGMADDEGDIINYTSTGLPLLESKSIAPMQAFIVTTKDGYNGTPSTLKITKDMSVTAPGLKLRSSAGQSGMLRITASNTNYASQAVVVVSEKSKNGFDLSEDTRRMLIQGVTSAPSVFTIVDDIYVDINRIKDFPESLPIGISTTAKGVTNIHIEGFNTLDYGGDFSFLDTKAGTTPIQGNEFEYSFNNTEGNQIGRFYLLYSPHTKASIEENSSGSLQIFVQDDNIHIVSAAGDPIENAVIYDIAGRILFRQGSTKNSYLVIPLTGLDSIIIVKANTHRTSKTSKLSL